MRRSRHRLSPLLLVVVFAGCGGGSRAPAPSAVLQGTLSVPQLGAGRLVHDRDLDSIAHLAQASGAIPVGDSVILRGRVGGDDRLDVFRVSASVARVVLSPPAGVRVEVFDAMTAQCVLVVPADRQAELRVHAPMTLDIAVAARRGEVGYEVEVRAVEDVGSAAAEAPLAPFAPGVESALLPVYLGADHEMVPGEVLVQFGGDAVAPLDVVGALARLGLVPAVATTPGPLQKYRVTAPLAAALELETCAAAQRAAAVPGVRAASPNYVYRALQNNPNDPLFARQWHYAQINVPQAWALFAGTPGSSSVIVSVVDTGMVLGHPDFAGRLVAGYDLISDPARALDGDGIDADPDDPGDNMGTGLPSTFHGTHVGGTVGATTHNGTGVAGMDWNCKLMPVRVLGKNGGTLEDIAQGIRFAAGLSNASGTLPPQRADIVNLSLGGPASAAVLEIACGDADNAGVLLVVAAGNDNSATPNFPASYAECLSVGAVRFDKQRAPYSNFANTIDVLAPGGDMTVDQNGDGDPDGVLSCLAAHQGSGRLLGFGYLQGTSMAAPHVAGLAAMVKARAPASTNAQLRALIENNTETVAAGKLVDALAACTAAGNPPTNPILRAERTTLALTAAGPTANVALSNVGNLAVTLQLQQNLVAIAYQDGNGWLAANLAGGAGTIISHPRIDVTANPTGLADGRYRATITIAPQTAGVNSVHLTVVLSIGQTGGGADEVFVVVVDAATASNRGQARTDAAGRFAYSIGSVPVGSYLLVAGTDRDRDGLIGDEGELFGIWPSSDAPLVLSVSTPGTLTGLDFTLQLRSVQQSVGGRILPPIAIR